MVAHKLTLFANRVRKLEIEGIFGDLYPVVSLQGSIAGPARIDVIDFEQSSFKDFDWAAS